MSKTYLLLTKNYPPQIWWIEQYSQSVFNYLVNQGHKVYLIKTWPKTQSTIGKILLLNFWRLFWLFCESITVWYFYSRKADIIWGMDWSLWFMVYFLSKINSKKSRLTLHWTDIVWNNFFYQKMMPFFWRKINEIYSVGPFSTQEIKKRWIPQSIIFFKPLSVKDLWLIKLGTEEMFLKNNFIQIPHNKIILFSIGRFVNEKWFDWFLAKILPFLDANRFHYYLAWDGPYLDMYRKIVSDFNISNITLTGPIIKKEHKAFLFQKADYLIFPSRREWNPVVLMEAQFYSLPAILYPFKSSEYFSKGNYILKEEASDWIDFINSIYL